MEKIWKKYKVWLGIAGYAIIILLIFFFLIIPILRNIKFNVDETQRRAIDIELSQARISKIGEMEKSVKVFSEKENDLDIMLHPDGEVQFIQNLESLAEETGNEISIKIKEDGKAKIKEPEKGSIINVLPYKNYIGMEVTLEGDYNGLVNFVSKIESMKWCVGIISIKAARSEKSKNTSVSSSALFSANSFVGNSGKNNNGNADEEVLKSIIDLAVCVKK